MITFRPGGAERLLEKSYIAFYDHSIKEHAYMALFDAAREDLSGQYRVVSELRLSLLKCWHLVVASMGASSVKRVAPALNARIAAIASPCIVPSCLL